VGEPRSVAVYQHYVEASQKFDYFVAGLTGALCAYIAQSWKPQKMTHLGPDSLEFVALLLLFAAAVAGFKRIEWVITMLRINTNWLDASEKRGAMADAIQESGGRLMLNKESGEVLSLFDAMQHYRELSSVTPDIQKKLGHAKTKAERWYRWRNRLLFIGFSVLVASRFATLFW
jgi:hypothetical protein